MSDVSVSNHWHYQLMRHTTMLLGEPYVYYALHEMYPSLDAWTEKPVGVTGDSVEDIKKTLLCMLHDIDKYGVKDYE